MDQVPLIDGVDQFVGSDSEAPGIARLGKAVSLGFVLKTKDLFYRNVCLDVPENKQRSARY